MRWCTSKWTLGNRRKKREGGITPRLPFHYPNIFYTKPDKKIYIFLGQYSSYFPCQMNWTKNSSRQIVLSIYIRTVYRRILKVMKQAGECCYFLNGSLYELDNPLCLWISTQKFRRHSIDFQHRLNTFIHILDILKTFPIYTICLHLRP